MSPTLNESSAIWRYEHSDAIETRNRITFNFYTGLPHLCKSLTHKVQLPRNTVSAKNHIICT